MIRNVLIIPTRVSGNVNIAQQKIELPNILFYFKKMPVQNTQIWCLSARCTLAHRAAGPSVCSLFRYQSPQSARRLYKRPAALCHCKQGSINTSLHLSHLSHTQSQSHTNTHRDRLACYHSNTPAGETRRLRFVRLKNAAEVSGQHRAAGAAGSDGGSPGRILLHHHGRRRDRNHGGQKQTEDHGRLRRTDLPDHPALALCEGILQNDAANASECVYVCVYVWVFLILVIQHSEKYRIHFQPTEWKLND